MNYVKNLHDWSDPINLAYSLEGAEESWVLLYSSLNSEEEGRYSYLAFDKKDEIICDSFEKVDNKINHSEDMWFGYFSYEMKNSIEDLPVDKILEISMPCCWFMSFHNVIVFDHFKKKITHQATSKQLFKKLVPEVKNKKNKIEVESVSSNMSKHAYIEKVKTIKKAIVEGEIYQANLTRKFFGQLKDKADYLLMFKELCSFSPSPYSALLKFKGFHVISSSPERFIKIDNNMVSSKPIKGSAKRGNNTEQDKKIKSMLQKSVKDRAENLMIVDLMRNDFAKACIAGSIKVPKLFELNSYKTIHHLSSTIAGLKDCNVSGVQFVRNCFPPGSMTGTPKIQAIKICSKLEFLQRGVYSGGLGWVSKDNLDLSVVIRTIILSGKKFEFQVGGAIVHDSEPESEWEETLIKATAIAKLLNINFSKLADI